MWHMMIPNKFHRQPKCFKKIIFAKAAWTKRYTIQNEKETLATNFSVGKIKAKEIIQLQK